MTDAEREEVRALLSAYLHAAMGHAMEYTTNVGKDARAIRDDVRLRAERLGVPEPDYDWSPYLWDEEER